MQIAVSLRGLQSRAGSKVQLKSPLTTVCPSSASSVASASNSTQKKSFPEALLGMYALKHLSLELLRAKATEIKWPFTISLKTTPSGTNRKLNTIATQARLSSAWLKNAYKRLALGLQSGVKLQI